jgi:membrane dipeptidase
MPMQLTPVPFGLLLIAAIGCAHPSASSPSPSARQAGSANDSELVARARAIHSRIITIDTHKDIPENFATAAADPKSMRAQVNLDNMKTGGYDMAFFAVYVGQGARTDSGDAVAKARAMNKFNAIHRMADEMYPDLIQIAYTPEDVVRIHDSGKLVAGIGIENGWVIGHDLSLIKKYYDLGARYMTLAHMSNNDICDSSTDPRGPEWHGLSPFGREVVAEMNRVGMMVDVSHVSRECMMQATALSTSPVIASHSATTAYANVPRNMDDEMLRAVGKNGGVVQIVAVSEYVKVPRPGDAPANVADFVNHIDHAVKIAGIDHVGISSDFDGGGGVDGWRDASQTFNVTLELVRRGYSEEDIRKIWGGNLLRVWAENTRRAKSKA